MALADRVSVLRDGRLMATLPIAEVTRDGMVRLMVGRDVDLGLGVPEAAGGRQRAGRAGAARRRLRGVADRRREPARRRRRDRRPRRPGRRRPHRAGPRAVRPDAGRRRHDCHRGPRPRHPHAGRGRAPRPGLRARGSATTRRHRRDVGGRQHGARLARPPRPLSRFGLLDRAAERAEAQRFVTDFAIRTPSIDAPVGTLSGGNQQKVALARWLATKPRLLILDEPTQGVDIGAKAEIHRLIRALAADGLAILLISSELTELLGLAHRIGVMRGGRLAGVLDHADATEERLMSLALGHTPLPVPARRHRATRPGWREPSAVGGRWPGRRCWRSSRRSRRPSSIRSTCATSSSAPRRC